MKNKGGSIANKKRDKECSNLGQKSLLLLCVKPPKIDMRTRFGAGFLYSSCISAAIAKKTLDIYWLSSAHGQKKVGPKSFDIRPPLLLCFAMHADVYQYFACTMIRNALFVCFNRSFCAGAHFYVADNNTLLTMCQGDPKF